MIRFENVVKRFDGQDVLSGVSFTVSKGEVLAVVGPSGTGKSVTLKHLVRLLTPTSGKVFLEDVEISAATGRTLEAVRARFGYLFQGGALLGWLTVAENVALPLKECTRLSEAEIDAKVREALAAVDLTAAADRYPGDLDIVFRQAAKAGEALVSEWCDAGEGRALHAVRRAADGALLATAATVGGINGANASTTGAFQQTSAAPASATPESRR